MRSKTAQFSQSGGYVGLRNVKAVSESLKQKGLGLFLVPPSPCPSHCTSTPYSSSFRGVWVNHFLPSLLISEGLQALLQLMACLSLMPILARDQEVLQQAKTNLCVGRTFLLLPFTHQLPLFSVI